MIHTDHWPKPIPLRRFDWEAYRDGAEPPDPIGYGETEEEAVKDLREREAERD